MSQLVRYEQARYALAECQRVDEVKDIRDKAEAMAAYARQAKDTEMIQWATEIKVRAERRCGELLRSNVATPTERGQQGAKVRWDGKSEGATCHPTTLAEMGLTKDQSSRYQSLAGMSEEHFETAVATAKDTAGQVTTAFMLREANKAKPHKRTNKKDEKRLQELADASARGVSMLSTYARLTLTAVRAQQTITEEELSVLLDLAAAIEKVSQKS